jgi:hypothetical protein
VSGAALGGRCRWSRVSAGVDDIRCWSVTKLSLAVMQRTVWYAFGPRVHPAVDSCHPAPPTDCRSWSTNLQRQSARAHHIPFTVVCRYHVVRPGTADRDGTPLPTQSWTPTVDVTRRARYPDHPSGARRSTAARLVLPAVTLYSISPPRCCESLATVTADSISTVARSTPSPVRRRRRPR